MNTQITHTAITAAPTFDTSILAGTKSPATVEQYRMHFGSYTAFAEDYGYNPLAASTLALWRQDLLAAGYSTPAGKFGQYSVNAVNQRLSAVRGVMVEAAQQGYISHDTAEQFRGVKGLKQSANKDRRNVNARTKISKADMLRLIDAPDTDTAAGTMHRALLMTMASTGLRASEIVSLTQSQIELHTDEDGVTGWVVNVAGKGTADEKPRALGGKAKYAVNTWLQLRSVDSDFIFTGFAGRGNRPTDKPISRQAAWKIVQRYADDVGLKSIKPHDFRRYVGTQLAKQDIRLAQNQLGHKRIETTAQNYVLDSVKVGATDDLI